MRFRRCISLLALALGPLSIAATLPSGPFAQQPLSLPAATHNVSAELFVRLEELSRLVDIAYCVGTTGIATPFICASRCQEFPDFQLVTVRPVSQRQTPAGLFARR